MTAKELAERLDGIQYKELVRYGISRELYKEAKESGLVFVHGASDDLIEFGGAIEDEGDCFDGGDIYFTKDGIHDSGNNHIEALWCEYEGNDGNEVQWVYDTDIPRETFKVYEDDELYCIGIVFSVDDLV